MASATSPHPIRAANFGAQSRALVVWLVITDALLATFSLRLAYDVRISGAVFAYYGPQQPQVYAQYFWLGMALWPAMFALAGLYRVDRLLGGVDEYRAVLKACAMSALALVVLSFLRRDEAELSRGWILIVLLVSATLALVSRFISRRIAYALRRRGFLTARVLIVGANAQGAAILRQWNSSPTSGMRVIGFLDDFKPIGTCVGEAVPVLGPPTALDAIAREQRVDEVVLVQNAVSWETFNEIVSRPLAADAFTLRLSPGYYDILTNNATLATKSFVPLFTINHARIVDEDVWLKRGLDYGLGALAFVISLPFAALFAIWLKALRLTVLDRHPTLGRNDQPFIRYQFHTRKDGVALERFLIRSGLDKLPQLFNVVMGQMALVGVRPRLSTDEAYLHSPARAILRAVKPGFVGFYSFVPLDSPESEQRDLHYVRNWTVWQDIAILKDSALAVFGLRKIRDLK
ncbi:MAG TPA: sugar transferase [Thermoflexales bacterium]|nr:sugar transferase [Thermoflexales bacterium]HQZ23029.1 sugar transferase [Thermoflexales bacterium]